MTQLILNSCRRLVRNRAAALGFLTDGNYSCMSVGRDSLLGKQSAQNLLLKNDISSTPSCSFLYNLIFITRRLALHLFIHSFLSLSLKPKIHNPNMEIEQNFENLKIILFPFMGHGHMIPSLDLAKLLAARGALLTILTTPVNAHFFSNSIQRSRFFETNQIQIKTIRFPFQEAGLPEGLENTDPIIDHYEGIDLLNKFILATKNMKADFENVLEESKPDCLISDMMFPWMSESAAKYDVPRFLFHGTSFFAWCAIECVRDYAPHERVQSDSEPFVVTNLPGDIVLTRNLLTGGRMKKEKYDEEEEDEGEKEIAKIVEEISEGGKNSQGIIFNSFYELEPKYVDFYRNEIHGRAWHIGPFPFVNKKIEEKIYRGGKSAIDEYECLKWLDSRKPGSVIYLCFGSTSNFSDEQLIEIAVGLERSQQDFIWVVKRTNKRGEREDWLPNGFEERTKENGLIIRGWAPQMLILNHQAVGGFMTHCGWNSVLEGITEGVPMVTWPVSIDQIYNQKLVTQVLKTGVEVGVEKLVMVVGDFVGRDKVEKAVRELMAAENDAADERRRRAKLLAEMAKIAVEQGGSSYNDLNNLISAMKKVGGH